MFEWSPFSPAPPEADIEPLERWWLSPGLGGVPGLRRQKPTPSAPATCPELPVAFRPGGHSGPTFPQRRVGGSEPQGGRAGKGMRRSQILLAAGEKPRSRKSRSKGGPWSTWFLSLKTTNFLLNIYFVRRKPEKDCQ